MTSINDNSIYSFYLQQGPMSEPGGCKGCTKQLPSDVPMLVKAVQNLNVHIFWAKGHGLDLSEDRKKEVTIRKLKDKIPHLAELGGHDLISPRPAERRLVSNCRDYSLFMTSFLRAKGIPARARCGFSTYFTPGHYEDHWVCEYWHDTEKRWVMLDAQLDELQMNVLKPAFNPLDMPAGYFLPGGKVWQMCRKEGLDPNLCGILEYKGWDFVRGNVIRDLLALTK